MIVIAELRIDEFTAAKLSDGLVVAADVCDGDLQIHPAEPERIVLLCYRGRLDDIRIGASLRNRLAVRAMMRQF